jgi:hypothetical protein
MRGHTKELIMRTTIAFIAAAAFALAPAASLGQGRPDPGSISPHHATGQPGAECGDEDALSTPGNSSSAPGSAFNPDGHAGTVYAGEQDQNSKNTASVSQYDIACENVSAGG